MQHHSHWKNQQWVIIAILLNTASAASGRKEPASELQQQALTNFSAFYVLESLERKDTLVSPN